jgi:hypothetical protein
MSANAYPLQWPKGWPITEDKLREKAQFKATLESALIKLRKEISLMGGKGLVLSSNYTLGANNPNNPGVVAYFTLEEANIAIPCDRWYRIEQNVHAIALTIEAMRGIERWGAKHMIKAMFTGFKALPEKGSGIDPHKVLGIEKQNPSEAEITAAFRTKAKLYHTDIPGTGNAEKYAECREAHDLLMASARHK